MRMVFNCRKLVWGEFNQAPLVPAAEVGSFDQGVDLKVHFFKYFPGFEVQGVLVKKDNEGLHSSVVPR